MRAMNIANASKRDAQVGFTGAAKQDRTVLALPDGRTHSSTRFVKSTVTMASLLTSYGDAGAVGQAILEGDPEIDIETVGKLISQPLRLYVNSAGEIAYRVRLEQIVYNPDGTERERREPSRATSNVAVDTPLQWSKRSLPKAEAIRKFVFSRSYQLVHTSGLTFDFLYQMAAELDRENALRLVGSGPAGTGPLVLNAGGEPYRGFLEGRVQGDRYSLVLHLSNLELRPLPVGDPS